MIKLILMRGGWCRRVLRRLRCLMGMLRLTVRGCRALWGLLRCRFVRERGMRRVSIMRIVILILCLVRIEVLRRRRRVRRERLVYILLVVRVCCRMCLIWLGGQVIQVCLVLQRHIVWGVKLVSRMRMIIRLMVWWWSGRRGRRITMLLRRVSMSVLRRRWVRRRGSRLMRRGMVRCRCRCRGILVGLLGMFILEVRVLCVRVGGNIVRILRMSLIQVILMRRMGIVLLRIVLRLGIVIVRRQGVWRRMRVSLSLGVMRR